MKEIKVRIKTWQELEQEFGEAETMLYGSEAPKCIELDDYFAFTPCMEEELPEDRIIDVTEYKFLIGEDMVDEENDYFEWKNYVITTEMIKEYL